MAAVDVPTRYACAHVAALRAAAALLAARARPAPARRRPQKNAWVLLAEVAPELAEWATFFAAGAAKRAAAEAGSTRAVTEREADDLVRDADRFLAVVEQALGLAPHRSAPSCASPLTRPPPARRPGRLAGWTLSSTCTWRRATPCSTARPTRTSSSSGPPSRRWTPSPSPTATAPTARSSTPGPAGRPGSGRCSGVDLAVDPAGRRGVAAGPDSGPAPRSAAVPSATTGCCPG